VRAGTALLSGGEKETTTERALYDKVNVSLAEAVSSGNCDVERKLAGGCIESRCSTGGAAISSASNETADPIHSD